VPLGYVRTIREEILYEYATDFPFGPMALSSGGSSLTGSRSFETERSISDTIREWEREQELPKECVFCGSKHELATDHLIPQNRGGDSADNLVLACRYCNSSRGDKGIFE
jgi:hypothetical protein